MKGIIQIAGIRDLREAKMLLAAGVHQLGFPLRLDVHREDMTAAETAAVIGSLDPSAFAILITYLSRTEDLIALCRKTGCRRVQLHGEITLPQLKRLRSSQRDLFLIKSLIVRNRNLAGLKARMRSYTPYVDAFITDTFDPVTGAGGATGKIHDWEISRELVEVSARPVILAGGLNPVNVKQAILQVRPAGVDAHTGVEGPNGRKDEGRIRAFVREAMEAFEMIGGSNP
jgi:phosphoribosylanthranilate isomerase